MATFSITTTPDQDAAINRRRLAHNAATGGSETAVQYAQRITLAMYSGFVKDDANGSHTTIRDRWERSSDAQRTAATNQLAQ